MRCAGCSLNATTLAVALLCKQYEYIPTTWHPRIECVGMLVRYHYYVFTDSCSCNKLFALCWLPAVGWGFIYVYSWIQDAKRHMQYTSAGAGSPEHQQGSNTFSRQTDGMHNCTVTSVRPVQSCLKERSLDCCFNGLASNRPTHQCTTLTVMWHGPTIVDRHERHSRWYATDKCFIFYHNQAFKRSLVIKLITLTHHGLTQAQCRLLMSYQDSPRFTHNQHSFLYTASPLYYLYHTVSPSNDQQ